MKIFQDYEAGNKYAHELIQNQLWQGGLATWRIMDEFQKDWVINLFEDIHPEGIEIIDLNDYLWFQFDDDWTEYEKSILTNEGEPF